MIPGSIIVTPQVLIDRDQPYSAVKTIDLQTTNSDTTQTITVPQDTLITSARIAVYAQDPNTNKTYAITEQDMDRDQYKVLIKIAGRADFSEAPQDVFLFNQQANAPGFQGFTVPRNTDISIKCYHVANGTAINNPTFRFQVELAGYVMLSEKTVSEQRFNGR